ncbi:hypothetical protein CWI36_0196p0030 [Hamiltosporidium magnivora]|uniref:Uncharacterized protein n=1 Tax=Hamiltosporidium magnivora TaxID=148818 RepID=A0A4Q9LKX7_9MICR|nr:hypothetical protein CWI36_0196p0030 [Hamiltosporidium magnivora]
MEKNNLNLDKRGARETRIDEVLFLLLISFREKTQQTNINKLVSVQDENYEIDENNPPKRLKVTKSYGIDDIDKYPVKFKIISELKKTENEIAVPIKEISLEQFIHFHNFINSFYIFAEELSFENIYTIIYILDFLGTEDILLIENLMKVVFLKLNTKCNNFDSFNENYIQLGYGIHKKISFVLCKRIFVQYILLLHAKKCENNPFHYNKNGYLFKEKYSFLFNEDRKTILDLSKDFLDEYLKYIGNILQRKIIMNFIMIIINIQTIYIRQDYSDISDELECIESLQHAFINNIVVGNFRSKEDVKNLSFSCPEYSLGSGLNPKEFESSNDCRIVNLDFNEEFILENMKSIVFTETEIDINVFVSFLNNSKLESLILNNIKVINPGMDIKFASKNKSIKSFKIIKPKPLYKHHIYKFIDLLENFKELKFSSKISRDSDISFLKNLEIIENLFLENIKDPDFFLQIFKDMVMDKIKCIRFLNCEIYKIEKDISIFESVETIGFNNCVFKGIKITQSDLEYLTLLENLNCLTFSFCIFDEDTIYDFPAGSFKNIIVIYLEYHNKGNNKMIVQGFREKFSENILRIHFFNHL